MRRFHTVFLFYVEEFRLGRDDVENGHVCSSFCQAFSESKAAATGATSDEGRSSFERELFRQQTSLNDVWMVRTLDMAVDNKR